ncbi:MAG: hypothetical protein HY840_14530 [Bacteroidetes bacterium]|nr:hypothetical protein [Bacteroidota bacterium]
MRKAEFFVPSEVMAEFAQELASKNLSNSITGTTEENEVIVEIEYDRDEADEVDELEELLEKLREELEEEEDK